MPVTLEGFVQCACDSGLLSADVVEEVQRSLPPEQRPRTADDLADELVRRSLLTPYQAAQFSAQPLPEPGEAAQRLAGVVGLLSIAAWRRRRVA